MIHELYPATSLHPNMKQLVAAPNAAGEFRPEFEHHDLHPIVVLELAGAAADTANADGTATNTADGTATNTEGTAHTATAAASPPSALAEDEEDGEDDGGPGGGPGGGPDGGPGGLDVEHVDAAIHWGESGTTISVQIPEDVPNHVVAADIIPGESGAMLTVKTELPYEGPMGSSAPAAAAAKKICCAKYEERIKLKPKPKKGDPKPCGVEPGVGGGGQFGQGTDDPLKQRLKKLREQGCCGKLEALNVSEEYYSRCSESHGVI